MENPYNKKPISQIGKIQNFTKDSFYKRNYEKIAEDHIIEVMRSGCNPFMDQDLITELNEKTVKAIKKHLSRGKKILDAGLGTGTVLKSLSGYKKYGVDISLKYLSTIQDDIHLACAKLEDLPYKTCFFDGIICTDVLEHVLDLNKVIKELKRILKKDGILIVRVPFNENLTPYLEKNPYDLVHLRSLHKNSASLLFEKIFRFKIISIKEAGKTFQDSSFSAEKIKDCIYPNSIYENNKKQKRIQSKLIFNETLFLIKQIPYFCKYFLQSNPGTNLLLLALKRYQKRLDYLKNKYVNALNNINKVNKLSDEIYFSLFEGSELIIT